MANMLDCPVIWHFWSRVMEYKMEQLQKRALRFILNDLTSHVLNF